MRTIEEGKRIVNKTGSSLIYPKNKKINKKNPIKTKKTKRADSALPARSTIPSLPATTPASTGTTIVKAKSLDKSIKPSKATIFKTNSKDSLPLPAFGFIDICFCLDATGSMTS